MPLFRCIVRVTHDGAQAAGQNDAYICFFRFPQPGMLLMGTCVLFVSLISNPSFVSSAMNFSRISNWASGFQKTEDRKPSLPATQSAPQPIDPKQSQADRKMSFGSGAGSAMRKRLGNAFHEMTHSAGSRRGSSQVGLNTRAHLHAALEAQAPGIVQIAGQKLARDKAEIGRTLDGWAAGKSAGLEYGLKTFIQSGAGRGTYAPQESRLKKFFTGGVGQKRPEELANDSLRSAMTAVKTIKLLRSPERQSLQSHAERLSSAVIFNAVTYEGGERTVTPFNLEQFATQGSLEAIDKLNLPLEERSEVASRLKTALNEIDALNRAFINNEMYPPYTKFDPEAAVSVLVEEAQAQPHGEQLPAYTPHATANAYQPATHPSYGQPMPTFAPPPYAAAPAASYPAAPPPAYTRSPQNHPQAQMRPPSPAQMRPSSQGAIAAPREEPPVPGLKRSMATRGTSRKKIEELKRELENATDEVDEAKAYIELDQLSKNNPRLKGLNDYLAKYDPQVVRPRT